MLESDWQERCDRLERKAAQLSKELAHHSPQQHMKEFCKNCRLHKTRRLVVKGRGIIPAKVLFLGEAPGASENVTGIAFTGVAGRLLNIMLKEINLDSFYIYNCVQCRPPENRDPLSDEVLACAENVMKIFRLVKPKHVIFLGAIAEKYYKKEFPEAVRIIHPAALLRSGGTSSPYYLQTIRQLKEALL
jgi:DNA polymerase